MIAASVALLCITAAFTLAVLTLYSNAPATDARDRGIAALFLAAGVAVMAVELLL